MKIEHVAIWVKDIDKVCEFYRKYFGGEVQPLYHNPTKQFTSRFVTFDEGARLEIMHCPDMNVGNLAESKSSIGLTHLAFSVGSKEKVDRLTHQMSTEGVSVVGQPRTTGDGYYESVVLDPEGNRIEITI
ncbi:MAG: VOC family protein [Fibrobacter sp.]|nr:VOC family protein [Fibrobacter sp.]